MLLKSAGSRFVCPRCNPVFIFALYLSFELQLMTIFVAGDSTPFYVPVDNITLDCGASNNANDLSGRTWRADTTSALLDHNNASTISEATEPLQMEYTVPYKTARLSHSQFTYIFRVFPGPKFIRLYFYPASYSWFNASSAFFSVKAGPHSLLSNFSAALHARALGLEVFQKEFCLYVEDHQQLNVTFTPSPDVADAYAFINGIEIVSMPTNLYYSKDGDNGFNFVGQVNPRRLESDTALELMYRVNVGGQFVSPAQDTGMFRSWSADDDYLSISKSSTRPYNTTIRLRFTNVDTPNYTAPAVVYQTARSMGMNKTVNENYDLTWEFQVESVFTYFVRLHFCENRPLIQGQGDRVFLIDIANLTAESHADVIWWSGGNGIPVKRDYMVPIVARGSEKFQNLSIALHTTEEYLSKFSDAILSGIEIFKMSNVYNLAGPNPELTPISPLTATTPPSSQSTKNNSKTIGAIIGGAASGLVVLSLLFLFIFWWRSKGKRSVFSDGASWLGQFSNFASKSTKTHGSTLPSDLCRRFSLAEIKEATNNFDSVFVIGVGGFGSVYKGIINDGAISVAIKRLNPGSQQGANEFKTEIEMLSQLRYLHLVSLIGYCCEDGEMILVYDYMARGTLRDHLYKIDNPPLPWIQRLEICIGAARGLQYLHSGAKNTIIHRDVKTTNILLDEKWVAKISDFGLSKIGPNSMSKPHISTVVKGSFGYIDPEYYRLQRLTEKSDVYSFGVVLCEVLSARPPVSKSSFNKSVSLAAVSLAEGARQCYRNGTLDDIVDPYLKGKIAPDCLKKFSELAVSCLLENGTDRPSMGDVVWGLEFALQLQKTAVRLQPKTDINDDESPLTEGVSSADDSSDNMVSSGSALVIGSRQSEMTLTSSSDDQSFLSNTSDQKVTSVAVFSKIMNP